MRCASFHVSYQMEGLMFPPLSSKELSQRNQTHLKYLEIKSNKTFAILQGMNRVRQGQGRGPGGVGAGDLAFRSGVLTQERGDGAGFSDLFGERALHVFDGRVGSSVQQELHDVGKLARRCIM